ncbi:MAG: adenosylhomocysteinase, partial [Zestosphaera sp.]
SFANQALAVKYIISSREKLEKRVYVLPRSIDERIAEIKLASMNIEIDKLTEEQITYLTSWEYGT